MPERALPQGLRDALRDGRIVPFVGAGLSKGVRRRDSGESIFPDWMGLLERAATELLQDQGDERVVRALLNNNPPELLEAAKRVQNAVKPANWSKFLYKQFAVNKTIVAEDSLAPVRQVWRLGSRVVITTNYDRILEWASPDPQTETWHIENKFGLARFLEDKHESPTVWHLHGEIGHPNELILSPDGYTRLYHSENPEQTGGRYKAALTSLRTVLLTRRLLFVGFSFADGEFDRQLDWLRETFAGQSGPHYALVHKQRFNETITALKGVDVECIPYIDHGAPLLELLRELAEIASAGSISGSRHPVARRSRAGSADHKIRGSKVRNYRRTGLLAVLLIVVAFGLFEIVSLVTTLLPDGLQRALLSALVELGMKRGPVLSGDWYAVSYEKDDGKPTDTWKINIASGPAFSGKAVKVSNGLEESISGFYRDSTLTIAYGAKDVERLPFGTLFLRKLDFGGAPGDDQNYAGVWVFHDCEPPVRGGACARGPIRSCPAVLSHNLTPADRLNSYGRGNCQILLLANSIQPPEADGSRKGFAE